jgi:hypothetical protein
VTEVYSAAFDQTMPALPWKPDRPSSVEMADVKVSARGSGSRRRRVSSIHSGENRKIYEPLVTSIGTHGFSAVTVGLQDPEQQR